MLFSKAPQHSSYSSLEGWQAAYSEWICQREGWTFQELQRYYDQPEPPSPLRH
jgi:hypothetical protein